MRHFSTQKNQVKEGRQYEVNYEVCNKRGCSNVSQTLYLWTEPIVKGKIKILEPFPDKIVFKMPLFGSYVNG